MMFSFLLFIFYRKTCVIFVVCLFACSFGFIRFPACLVCFWCCFLFVGVVYVLCQYFQYVFSIVFVCLYVFVLNVCLVCLVCVQYCVSIFSQFCYVLFEYVQFVFCCNVLFEYLCMCLALFQCFQFVLCMCFRTFSNYISNSALR